MDYKRLYPEIKKQAIGEMKHAEALIERIIFMEGASSLGEFTKIKVGKTIEQ